MYIYVIQYIYINILNNFPQRSSDRRRQGNDLRNVMYIKYGKKLVCCLIYNVSFFFRTHHHHSHFVFGYLAILNVNGSCGVIK